MTTLTPTIEKLGDDPAVQEARQACAQARRELEDALAARRRLPPATSGQAVLHLSVLETDQKVRERQAAYDDAVARLRLAQESARRRLAAAWAPQRKTLERARVAALRAAVEATKRVELDEVARAAALGQAPAPLPGPTSVGLAAGAEAIERALDPPHRGPAPVPAGKVRVRVVQDFYDRDGIRRYRPQLPGDTGLEVLDRDDAERAVEAGWAERT